MYAEREVFGLQNGLAAREVEVNRARYQLASKPSPIRYLELMGTHLGSSWLKVHQMSFPFEICSGKPATLSFI
jgi:hypothetical protein